MKVDNTRARGAEIVLFDRRTESREAIAARIAEETGATVVPSFDDPMIVAGQGTSAWRREQMAGAAAEDLVPCGGGGLASGIALACPEAEIVVVEPEGWDDMARSLEAGKSSRLSPRRSEHLCDAMHDPQSVADHLAYPELSGGRRRWQLGSGSRPTRSASRGRSFDSWLSRAEQPPVSPALLAGKLPGRGGYGRGDCRAEISIRRCMSGSSGEAG